MICYGPAVTAVTAVTDDKMIVSPNRDLPRGDSASTDSALHSAVLAGAQPPTLTVMEVPVN
jgi:hypothetical protein